MKPIPEQLTRCVQDGLTLRDYAVLVALIQNKRPMSRQDLEVATGLHEAVVRRSTIRLREMKIIKRDKDHPVGGDKHRAARYVVA